VGVTLALLLIYGVDARLRPVLVDLAQSKTQNAVTELVSRAVEDVMAEGGWSYSDFVSLQTDAQGQVAAMTTDTVKLNTLRANILSRVVEETGALDSSRLGVPLGTVTGFSPAGGWWPTVPVRVKTVASATAEFQSEFIEAGINQTLHKIVLHVVVDARLLIPGGTVQTSLSTDVCIAETLIVGKVPDSYLQGTIGEKNEVLSLV